MTLYEGDELVGQVVHGFNPKISRVVYRTEYEYSSIDYVLDSARRTWYVRQIPIRLSHIESMPTNLRSVTQTDGAAE